MKKILILSLFLIILCGCAEKDKTDSPITTDTFDYKTVKMHSVNSTAISELGYSVKDDVLLVRFLDSGSLYAYFNVPKSQYIALYTADSIGSYYNQHIRDHYAYKRLEG